MMHQEQQQQQQQQQQTQQQKQVLNMQSAGAASSSVAPLTPSSAEPGLAERVRDALVKQISRPKRQNMKEIEAALEPFWTNAIREMNTIPLGNTSGELPLTRLRKIAKADHEANVSAEFLALLGQACSLFIMEVSKRAWVESIDAKRQVVERKDVKAAILNKDLYDFLVEVVEDDFTTPSPSQNQVPDAGPPSHQNANPIAKPSPILSNCAPQLSPASLKVESNLEVAAGGNIASQESTKSTPPTSQTLEVSMPSAPVPQTEDVKNGEAPLPPAGAGSS